MSSTLDVSLTPLEVKADEVKVDEVKVDEVQVEVKVDEIKGDEVKGDEAVAETKTEVKDEVPNGGLFGDVTGEDDAEEDTFVSVLLAAGTRSERKDTRRGTVQIMEESQTGYMLLRGNIKVRKDKKTLGKYNWSKRYFVYSASDGLLQLYHNEKEVVNNNVMCSACNTQMSITPATPSTSLDSNFRTVVCRKCKVPIKAKKDPSKVIVVDRITKLEKTEKNRYTIELENGAATVYIEEPEFELYDRLATAEKATLKPHPTYSVKDEYLSPCSFLQDTAFAFVMRQHQLRTFGTHFNIKEYADNESVYNSKKTGPYFAVILTGIVRIDNLKGHIKAGKLCEKTAGQLLRPCTLVNTKHIVAANAFDGPVTLAQITKKDYLAYCDQEADKEVLQRVHKIIGEDVLSQVKAISLFQDVTEARAKLIGVLLNFRILCPGEVLFNEGDVGHHLYMIYVGEVDAVSSSTNRTSLHTFNQVGECFGELALFLDMPRTSAIVAAKNTILLELSREDVQRALQFMSKRKQENMAQQRKIHAVEHFRKYKVCLEIFFFFFLFSCFLSSFFLLFFLHSYLLPPTVPTS